MPKDKDRYELEVISLADVAREEKARIEAMSMDDAIKAVLSAVDAVMRQEGDRIGAHPFDWTYHGCHPAWKALGHACADLAEKQFGVVGWRVPRIVIADPPSD